MSTLRNLTPWGATWNLLKTEWKKILPLTFWGLLLPLVGFSLYQSLTMNGQIELVKELGYANKAVSFEVFLESLFQFVGQYALSWLLVLMLMVMAFLAIIHQTYRLIHSQSAQNTWQALGSGLRTFFFRGFLTFLLLGVFYLFIGNFLLGLLGNNDISRIILLILVGFSFMVPVLLVTTQDKPFRLIRNCLTLNFAPPLRGIKWSIFFQVITWEFLLLAMVSLIGILRQKIVYLDLLFKIPRNIWLATFPELPFGPVYGALTIIVSGFSAIVLTFLAILMTVYYSHLNLLTNLAPKDEVIDIDAKNI